MEVSTITQILQRERETKIKIRPIISNNFIKTKISNIGTQINFKCNNASYNSRLCFPHAFFKQFFRSWNYRSQKKINFDLKINKYVQHFTA